MVRILMIVAFLLLLIQTSRGPETFGLEKHEKNAKFIRSLEDECREMLMNKHLTINELNCLDSLVEIIDVYKGKRKIRMWKTDRVVDPGIIY